ncbi:MAG: ComEC family competence protein, partial [Rhodospirillales bacterium]
MRLWLLALRDNLLEERQRWILWLPVGVGTGVAIYFQLRFEPPLWPFLVTAVIAGLVAIVARHRIVLWLPAIALLSLALGAGLAKFRVEQVRAPALTRELGPITVEGRLLEADPLPNGVRLT